MNCASGCTRYTPNKLLFSPENRWSDQGAAEFHTGSCISGSPFSAANLRQPRESHEHPWPCASWGGATENSWPPLRRTSHAWQITGNARYHHPLGKQGRYCSNTCQMIWARKYHCHKESSPTMTDIHEPSFEQISNHHLTTAYHGSTAFSHDP